MNTRRASIALSSLVLSLVSCGTVPSAASGAIDLPAHASPAEALQPLQFLAGKWMCVNPNKTVNEEHWMAPRGSCMIGTFRQVRLDGKCAFVEISQIAVENGQVVLRLRHMHSKLEVPDSRKEANEFTLVSVTDSRMEFKGSGSAEGVTSVVYERTGPDELVQSIGFDPEKSAEKPFVSTYRRVD